MTADPRAVPFRGREKRGEVVGDLVIAGLGSFMTAAIFVAVPSEVRPVQALAWYTAFAAAVTFVLALALLGTRQLPTLDRTELDGQPALGVRAWPGDWWHSNLLDLGLCVLAAVLTILGLRAGGEWAVATPLVIVPGGWLLVRLCCTLAGQRRNEALWVTADAVVHDTAWGRERCPRPWCTGRSARPGRMVVIRALMGHSAGDLSDRLRDQPALGADGRR